MKLTAETKVHDAVSAYPFLLDWLAEYDSEFERLRNPVLFNTIARAATLKQAAAMARRPLDEFLDDVRDAVARNEIAAHEASGSATPTDTTARAARQEDLKAIIRDLHAGASVDDVKARFDALVAGIDAAEIAAMEQALIAEGMPVSEVQRLCDVHVTVFKDALEGEEAVEVPAGHPIDTYTRENVVVIEITSGLRCSLDGLVAEADPDRTAAILGEIAAQLERLREIDHHYLRKENQLFPLLEAHDIVGPTQVMWGLDDEIRERIAVDLAAARSLQRDGVVAALGETLGMVDDMVYKEEKILFPTALEHLTEPEWNKVAEGEHELGFSWIEPPAAQVAPTAAPEPAPGGALPLPTGALTLQQLDVMFRTLPVDVTYVDAEDRVRFYSEGMRVFPRTPAAIGREVRKCHPPDSVDKVARILNQFRSGAKDVAEFWLEMGGRFIWIRYLAMRDATGRYQGCLEVVQDATHVRDLEGERRLLDWS
ncbi:MAG: DUF438 domain-containing protein [Coriobacteriales bacterium]|nr:DUF438 domain-containing protein [Coriobacteriales bacterium]